MRKLFREEAEEDGPFLPRDWAIIEMREREMVLDRIGIHEGESVLEVGCGRHALTTIPLAMKVGREGRVVAVERERWSGFTGRIRAAGLEGRVLPVRCDARKLPFADSTFDGVVCVHGFRSFPRRSEFVAAVREMLRVSRGPISIAESVPSPRNAAQRAHLAAYSLRWPTFVAAGRRDWGDVPYPGVAELRKLVATAGGRRISVTTFDPGTTAHLARLPMEDVRHHFLTKIKSIATRERLDSAWQVALKAIEVNGEEHLPVTVVSCRR